MKIKPLTTHTIIRIQRPTLWVASFVAIIVLLAVLFWWAVQYGRSVVTNDGADVGEYIIQLQDELKKTKFDLLESRRRVTVIERNNRIDVDAAARIKDTLVEAKDEALSLKKELSFYKNLVSPKGKKSRIELQTVSLTKKTTGGYLYKIMVKQSGKNDRLVRGSVSLSIKGLEDDVSKKLNLSQLTKQSKKTINFAFKYFQKLEGVITLPADFQAKTVDVVVKPRNTQMGVIKKQFSWSDLIAGES